MIDIFTVLLGVVSICALTGAVFKILLAPPRVWDDEDEWAFDQIEAADNYDDLRREHPHIWMD